MKNRVIAVIIAFLIGVLIGSFVLPSLIGSKHQEYYSTDPNGDHMVLEDNGPFGGLEVYFKEAILGERKELKKLEVYSIDVSDVATIVDKGFANLGFLTKTQYINYHGTAVYTVDLSGLSEDSIALDEENKKVFLTVPAVNLEPINIPSENIEIGDIKRGSILALGKVEITPDQAKAVETAAKNRMIKKLDDNKVIEDATKVAEASIWGIFQPIISNVSPDWSLEIRFE